MILKNSTSLARGALRRSITLSRAKVNAALPISLSKKGSKERSKFAAAPWSLADDAARLVAGDLLIDELARHHKRSKKTNRRHFLITFCWDEGVIPAEPPHELCVKSLRAKMYKALIPLGIHGIGVIEVSPLRRTKEEGPRLLAHGHVFGFIEDENFKPKVAAKALSASRAFPNSFGAASVTIRSRKMAATNFRAKKSDHYDRLFSKLHRDQTKASLTWLGYYLMQAPAYVKQVCPDKRNPGKNVMRSSYTSYSPQLALALHQFLSGVQFTDAVFSIGKEGGRIGRAWRKRFKDHVKSVADKQCPKKGRHKKRSKAAMRRRRARQANREHYGAFNGTRPINGDLPPVAISDLVPVQVQPNTSSINIHRH